MTKKTKILLALSLGSFALGCTGLLWGVGVPLGAVLLGLALISKLLEKETALFDQEEHLRLEQAEGLAESPQKRLADTGNNAFGAKRAGVAPAH